MSQTAGCSLNNVDKRKQTVFTKDMTNHTFQVGQTYSVHSICDYDCIFSFEVVKRTARFITVRKSDGSTSRVGVKVWDGEETAMPLGSYSMAPTIRAGR